MNLFEIMQTYFMRGVTFRKTATGARPMYHRWPATKIKGAITIAELMAESVTRHNALLRHLMKNKGRRISPRDRD